MALDIKLLNNIKHLIFSDFKKMKNMNDGDKRKEILSEIEYMIEFYNRHSFGDKINLKDLYNKLD